MVVALRIEEPGEVREKADLDEHDGSIRLGRIGLINSGGESKGASDLAEAVGTAVINKRAGGQGLISGRKAFQKPLKEGVELLNAIQDVYLDNTITLA